MNNVIGILIGIALNLWIAFGSKAILRTLILPIQEHGISYHFFVSPSISLSVFYHFKSIALSPSWLKFILVYFILLMQF